MRLYFDTAYVAKCYLHEPDGTSVRALAAQASGLFSSAWTVAELACTFHRHVREGSITARQGARLRRLFLNDLDRRAWVLFPITERLLFQVEAETASLSPSTYVRAGDAVHLVCAREAGFTEVWTSDRRMLAAAPHFGLAGRSV